MPFQRAQQGDSPWIGGHGTLPYEQNTQQSPGNGDKVRPHVAQSRKNWQASTGMEWLRLIRQLGHVTTLSRARTIGTSGDCGHERRLQRRPR
jgi:hypothetical protein